MKKNTVPNPFPSVFPSGISDFILKVARALNCSEDFIASSILIAVSIAIGSKSRIQIKKGWSECCILFLIIVGEPGSKKTPAIKIVLEPIFNLQRLFASQILEETDTEDEKEERRKNILTTDATIEALAILMFLNPHGILLLRDEAIGWIKSMNQYKSGGDDMEKYLALFSQTPLSIHRKKGPQIQVNEPFLVFLGGIQVDLLESLSAMKDNGFIERFVFCYPNPVPIAHSDFEIDDETKLAYQNLIMGIYNSQINSESKVFEFSPKAQALWNEWHISYCDKMNEPSCPYYMISALSKLEAYTAKFALILEYLKCAESNLEMESISEESLRGAILLNDYFAHNFIKVRSSFASSALDKKIQGVVMWLNNNGYTAKSRQIYTNRVAGIKTADEVYDIFMEMKARGLGTLHQTADGKQKTYSFILGTMYQIHKNQ